LVALLAGGTAHAQAQDNVPATLEEITVTARHREESLQEVPISISVVQGAKLADSGVTRLEELTGSIPNFNVSATPIGDTISMRGVNSDAQTGAEQSVGTFVDGVFRGRGVQSRFAFLDVGHVEVVRGPQGTLFGKNTIAGALNISSARPTASPAGEISVSREFENEETEIRAFVAGPLSDRLRGRAAIQWNDLGKGWVKNAFYDETLPTYGDWAGRLSLEGDLAEHLTVFARYDHGRMDVTGQPFELAALYNGPPPAIGALGLFVNTQIKALGVDGRLDGRAVIGNTGALDLGTAYRMTGTTDEGLVRLDWQAGPGTLTALAGYSAYEFERDLDADNGPLSILNILEHERYDQTSLEVRYASDDLGPVRLLAGGYWQRSNLVYGDPHTGNYANFAAVGVAVPVAQRLALFDQDEESWSGFGQITLRLADNLRWSGGLRYSSEEKSARQLVDLRDLAGAPLSGPVLATYRVLLETWPHDIHPSRSENGWTYSTNLQWTVAPGKQLYATVSTGEKGGGFNAFYFATGGPRTGETALQFQDRMTREAQFLPEKAISYELGAKLSLGASAELNLAAFYSRFENLQVSQFTGATTFIVSNAASAETRGVEIDGRWRVSAPLELHANLAWLNFEFTNYRNAGCTAFQALAYSSGLACANAGGNDLSGRTNQDSPEWTGAAGASYTRALGSGRRVRLAVDATYVGKYYAAGDLDPATVQKAYTKIDAIVAYGSEDGRWEVALVGRNLTDERTYQDANDLPLATGTHRVTVQRPRTIALRLKAGF
jgi:outer membrane receptor protein involved in Fe transport